MFIVQQLSRTNFYFFPFHMELYFHCRLRGKAWGGKKADQLGRRAAQTKKENFVKTVDSKKNPVEIIVIFLFCITVRIIVFKKPTTCLHINA